MNLLTIRDHIGNSVLFGPYKLTHIMALKDKVGQFTHSPQEITKVLKAYYTSLYSEDPIDQDFAQSFLEGLSLRNCTMPQLEVLNAPISSEEITCMVKALANNKALGPD